MIAILVMTAIATATITQNEITMPDTVKAGQDYSIYVSYNTTFNQSTVKYNQETVHACTQNQCSVNLTRTAPQQYGTNISMNITITDENDTIQTSHNAYAQLAYLTINTTQANVTQATTTQGRLYWEDGTGMQGKEIQITYSFGKSSAKTTGSNGYYVNTMTVPDHLETGIYEAKTTSSFPKALTASQNMEVKGRTENPSISFDPNYISVNGVAADQQKTFQVQVKFNHTLNSPNSYQINMTLLGNRTSSTSQNYQYTGVVHAGTQEGAYLLTANATWTNDDGTKSKITATMPIYVNPTQSMEIDTSNVTNVNTDVGGNRTFIVPATNKGNTQTDLIYSISGDIPPGWITMDGKDELDPGEQSNITFLFKVPYTAKGNTYHGQLMVQSVKKDFTIKVIEPQFRIKELEDIYTLYQEPNFTIEFQIENNGTMDAKELKLIADCPNSWKCEFDDDEIVKIEKGKSIPRKLEVEVSDPEAVARKEIKITAKDTGDRKAEATATILINTEATNVIAEDLIVYYLTDPNYNQYYFVNSTKLVPKDTLNTSGIDGRVQRNSSISSWSVMLGNKTKGLGTICTASIIVGDTIYELDNKTSREKKQNLVGELGEYAYEVIQFQGLGECVIHLKYGEKETVTHVITAGIPPETSFQGTLADVEKFVRERDKEYGERQDEQMMYILAGCAVILGAILIIRMKGNWLKGHVYSDKINYEMMDKIGNDFKKIKGEITDGNERPNNEKKQFYE